MSPSRLPLLLGLLLTFSMMLLMLLSGQISNRSGTLISTNVVASGDSSALDLDLVKAAMKEVMDDVHENQDGIVAANEQPKCKPRHQVAFAKTHKTGSSTIQNILLR